MLKHVIHVRTLSGGGLKRGPGWPPPVRLGHASLAPITADTKMATSVPNATINARLSEGQSAGLIFHMQNETAVYINAYDAAIGIMNLLIAGPLL